MYSLSRHTRFSTTASDPPEQIRFHQPGELSDGAVLDVGLKCIHSCRFCYYSFLDGSERQFSGIRKARFRTLDQCRQILDLLAVRGFYHVDVTGGEPTLHPHIVEMVRHGQQKLGLKMRIITLGQLLDRRSSPGKTILDDLLDAGITNFLFSIHAADPNLFARITGGRLEKLESAMDKLDAIGFDYTGNTTVFSGNYRHLPELARLLCGHRIYLHNFILMNAYYSWNRNGRAFGVQARYREVLPYLKEAVSILEENSIAVNVRYAPLCVMAGLERNLVGVVGVRYDPYEWRNRGGHSGGPPQLCATPVAINPGQVEQAFALRRASGHLPNGLKVFAVRGSSKVFVDPCLQCLSIGACDGIDPNYLIHHGADEFSPLRRPESGPLLSDRLAYKPAFVVKAASLAPAKKTVAHAFHRLSSKQAASKPHGPILSTLPLPQVSIVIVNLNGGDRIQRCLQSVVANTGPVYELIIVDNGSSDDSIAWIESLPFVTLVRNPNNVGAPLARNQALSLARGQFVVFLDNDTQVTPGWLDRFLEHAVRHPDTGVFGPRSNNVSGPQLVQTEISSNIHQLDEYARNWARTHHGQSRPIRRLILFCLFVRRQVIDIIGGFDPAFGKWGWEDDDFCVRAQLAGFPMRVADDIFIYHEGSYTSRSANLDYDGLAERNWQRFKEKWNITWQPGCATKEQLENFFSQPFDPGRHHVPLCRPNSAQVRPAKMLPPRPSTTKNKSRPATAKTEPVPNNTGSTAKVDITGPEMLPEQLDTGRHRVSSGTDPGDTVALVLRAMSQLKNGNPTAALELFEKAARADHPTVEALHGAAVCYRLLGRLQRAIDYGQRAAAGLVDVLGVQPWYRQYLENGNQVPEFAPGFCATVYGHLALCLEQAGRQADASLCAEAACHLDRCAPAARAVAKLAVVKPDTCFQAAITCPPAHRVPSLSVVILTHPTDKLEKNAPLAPPSAGLVETTWQSWLKALGPGLNQARKLVCLDGFAADNQMAVAYRHNLELFCRRHGFELLCRPPGGLLATVAAVAPTLRSDWLLLLEHDWRYIGPQLELCQLLSAIHTRYQIHSLRFNQRPNLIRRFDYLLEVETSIPELPLLRTPANSNNPSLVRTGIFAEKWLPVCLRDQFFSHLAGPGSSTGLEEVLFKLHRDQVRCRGMAAAHRNWGTYLLGRPGDGPLVEHLGC